MLRATSTSEKHAKLFGSLDRAALDPAAWNDVCDGLAALVGATGGLLIPYDVEDRTSTMPHSPRLGEMLDEFIKSGWVKRDFRATGFPKAISTGFVTDQDLITIEEMRKHPYYAEWLASFGLQWFAGIAFTVEGKTWGAAVQGTPERGPFLSDDVEQLLRVRENLSLAARRAAALGNQRVASLEAAFAASERGVLALGWSGRIAWQNARAEAMLRDCELVGAGRLRSADPALDRKLANLVDGALGFRPNSGLVLPSPVLAPARDGRTLSVDAIPMPRDFRSLLSGASVLVTLHEVAPARLGVHDLRARFRLTAREMELSAHLLSGKRLAHAAEMMGMSVSTARQHVKSVFAKTGTHGQAELVALLGRLDS